jgi:putative tricarboxylic transport membrane protein
MKQRWMMRGTLSVCLVAAVALPHGAAAQGWVPERHVEIISPAGAGGSVDAATRNIERIMRELKLVPVSTAVVNRAGAEHAIAYNYIKQRAGDPHFLSVTSQVLITNNISGVLPISFRDVTPIATMLAESYVFVVHPDSRIRTGKDFIETLRDRPESITISIGNLAQRIAVAVVAQAAGGDIRRAKIVTITGAKTSISVAGGHVDVGVAAPGQSLGLIEGGKLRAIAVSGEKRLGGPLANIPAWPEFGLENATSVAWRGIIAPPGITDAQVAYWENVLRRVSETSEFREAGEKRLFDTQFRGAAEARRFMENEYAQHRKVMTTLGLVK